VEAIDSRFGGFFRRGHCFSERPKSLRQFTRIVVRAKQKAATQ